MNTQFKTLTIIGRVVKMRVAKIVRNERKSFKITHVS